jgi:hypothetical protein
MMILYKRSCFLVFLIVFARTARTEIKQYSALCEMHLSRIVGATEPMTVGDERLDVKYASDQEHFESLRQGVRAAKANDFVVYAFVETRSGMTSVRFQKDSRGKVEEEVVGKSDLSEDRFNSSLLAARQPLADSERKKLEAQFLPPDRSMDKGKIVFFFDLALNGVLPGSFGSPAGLILASNDIDRAVQNARELSKLRVQPSDFNVYMGYPETNQERQALFGDTPTAPLADWRLRAQEMRQLGKDFGFKVFGLGEMNRLGSKEAVLRSIEESKAIIWIVAHSGGCFIRLSTGEKIQITPGDIGGLKLLHSPFVIVRVCEAGDEMFAQNFLRAGARAVWINTGEIYAKDVNAELSVAMPAFKKQPLLPAVNAITSGPIKHASALGLAVHLETPQLSIPNTDKGLQYDSY